MIPPNLSLQQPGQTVIFSPSLPTSIQQGFHPPFIGHIPGNGMTPVQAEFIPIPMPTAGRPINHRARASIAQLAAAGVPPPIGVPLTPFLAGQFPQGIPPMLMSAPQFQPRSRRAPSVSTGGPPKAVLGGPGAKNRVTTETVPTPVTTIAPPPKSKKVVVNIPRETIPVEGDGEEPGDEALPRRENWARVPRRPSEVPEIVDSAPPEVISAESFPPEIWRTQLPPTVDVFLPRKVDLIWSLLTRNLDFPVGLLECIQETNNRREASPSRYRRSVWRCQRGEHPSPYSCPPRTGSIGENPTSG